MLWRLALALVLSSAIGLEREQRQKAAGDVNEMFE